MWFVGGYNILAGIGMMIFYHEGFRILEHPQADADAAPAIGGRDGRTVRRRATGWWLWNPVENRNVLTLGFFSKFLGSILGVTYVAIGKLPVAFLPILFFADIVYLGPFLLIMRRLYAIARQNRGMVATQTSSTASRTA